MNKLSIAVACLAVGSASAFAAEPECSSAMDTYARNQTINAGMLDKLMKGQISHTITNDIGEQLKVAQALAEKGDYQESCDVYDAVIAKYGFKTIEETYYEQNPDKRPENQTETVVDEVSSSAVSSEASAVGSASSAAGPETESASDGDH